MTHPNQDAFRHFRNAEGNIMTLTPQDILKSELHHSLLHHWNISKHTQKALANYYLLVYTGEQLRNLNKFGKIKHRDGKEYNVVFTNAMPENAYKLQRVFVSFRAALPIYNLPAYALVSAVGNWSEDGVHNDI